MGKDTSPEKMAFRALERRCESLFDEITSLEEKHYLFCSLAEQGDGEAAKSRRVAAARVNKLKAQFDACRRSADRIRDGKMNKGDMAFVDLWRK